MKTQFQSSEDLLIRFPAFVDVTTGLDVSSDAVTITIRKPGGAVSTYNSGSTPAVTWDSQTGFWKLDIPVASYLEGEWLVKAVSNAANTNPQRAVFQWGDWAEQIANLHQMAVGRWKITGSTLTLYAADNESALFTFILKDDDGEPNGLRVFERVPNS